jgi:hypothetical protein
MTHETRGTSPAEHPAGRLCQVDPVGQPRSYPSKERGEGVLGPVATKRSQPTRRGADDTQVSPSLVGMKPDPPPTP